LRRRSRSRNWRMKASIASARLEARGSRHAKAE
jgi:hypothetical protein